MILFPSSGEMTPQQLKAELMLRIRYNLLKSKLNLIDTYDPVPDDVRASLIQRSRPRGVSPDADEDEG